MRPGWDKAAGDYYPSDAEIITIIKTVHAEVKVDLTRKLDNATMGTGRTRHQSIWNRQLSVDDMLQGGDLEMLPKVLSMITYTSLVVLRL